jgi:hypothetical protein
MSYNFFIQPSLTNNIMAAVGYVGSVMHNLVSNYGFDAALALQNPANSALSAEPFPGSGSGTIMDYYGYNNYNSLPAKLQKRFANGLNFLATYTWAHALDDSYDPIAGGVSDRNINLIPIQDEYSNSPYDIRHRFNFNGYYELPFGKGTASGSSAPAIMISNLFAPGGTPPPSNPNINCATHTRTVANWYNPCAFANPLPGSDIPCTGPGSLVTNLSQVYAYLGGAANRIQLARSPAHNTPDARFFQLSAKYVF